MINYANKRITITPFSFVLYWVWGIYIKHHLFDHLSFLLLISFCALSDPDNVFGFLKNVYHLVKGDDCHILRNTVNECLEMAHSCKGKQILDFLSSTSLSSFCRVEFFFESLTSSNFLSVFQISKIWVVFFLFY